MIGRKRRQKQRERARLKKQQAAQQTTTSSALAPATVVPTNVPAAVVVPTPIIVPRHPPGTSPPPNWNEAAYLAKHPDVAAGVRSGAVPSGLWHYLKSGQKEGRALAGLESLMSKRGLLALFVLGVAIFLWHRKS